MLLLSSLIFPDSDLVGTDDEDDALHICLRAHLLLHLSEPTVQSLEALPQPHVVHQQHTLGVFVELITNL